MLNLKKKKNKKRRRPPTISCHKTHSFYRSKTEAGNNFWSLFLHQAQWISSCLRASPLAGSWGKWEESESEALGHLQQAPQSIFTGWIVRQMGGERKLVRHSITCNKHLMPHGSREASQSWACSWGIFFTFLFFKIFLISFSFFNSKNRVGCYKVDL